MCHYRAEPLLIFSRGDEGTNHRMLLDNISQRRITDLAQPE
jgi:hypothetical protein